MFPMANTQQIAAATSTIALVGASDKPERASYGVMRFLLARGFTVYPVNPVLAGQELQGRRVYASLEEVPAPVDMVDIFRNTEAAAEIIDQAIGLKDALSIKTVWCQLGVLPYEAAARAEQAGMTVIVDKCPAIEWR